MISRPHPRLAWFQLICPGLEHSYWNRILGFLGGYRSSYCTRLLPFLGKWECWEYGFQFHQILRTESLSKGHEPADLFDRVL